MILGDPLLAAPQPTHNENRVTIDQVFRRVAKPRSDVLALADAPNRESFTDGAPRRLTYAQAERTVAAIAGRLRSMGLPTDAIVAIQLPNTVENVLTILGVLRAGMIAAPLPLLWRRADAVAALARIGAKALVTCSRVGAYSHCQFAMRAAAEVFSIRYVCGFGANLPDGVVPFDDLFGAQTPDRVPPLDRERQSDAARHIAAITFETGAGGIVPVARNHWELLAGGLGVLLEARLEQNANILTTLAPSSFAGISMTLLPWLLSGGALVLHHPFDADALARQQRDDRCRALILPGPVAFRLAETDCFAHEIRATVVAAWRAPERLATSPAWCAPNADLVDVSIFGEAGLVPARRADDKARLVPFGPVAVPHGGSDAVPVVELAPTSAGTLALRGPMVPHHSFPPGIERSGFAYFKIEPGGWVDTGYMCRQDAVTKAIPVSGPPAGIVSIGGYRFPLCDLRDVAGRLDGNATLAAVSDLLVGERLVGSADDCATMQAALDAVGVNPLVVGAFRAGGRHRAAGP